MAGMEASFETGSGVTPTAGGAFSPGDWRDILKRPEGWVWESLKKQGNESLACQRSHAKEYEISDAGSDRFS